MHLLECLLYVITTDAFARRHLPKIAAGTPADAFGRVLGKESFRQASVAVDRIDGLDEPADVAKPGRARERLQALAACRRTCQEKKGQRRQVDGEAAHQ